MAEDIKITGEPSRSGDRCAFIVDRPLFPGESAHFAAPEAAGHSPLAAELLRIPGIESVLIADNTVTVSAGYPVDWPALGIGNVIRKHLRTETPVVSDDYLRDLLDREINPAVGQHGGFVELIDVRKNNVYLRLGGGCQGCGAADVTLKQGIEKAIRSLAPAIGEILDTTDHAAGRNPYYAPAK